MTTTGAITLDVEANDDSCPKQSNAVRVTGFFGLINFLNKTDNIYVYIYMSVLTVPPTFTFSCYSHTKSWHISTELNNHPCEREMKAGANKTDKTGGTGGHGCTGNTTGHTRCTTDTKVLIITFSMAIVRMKDKSCVMVNVLFLGELSNEFLHQ